MKRRIIEVDSNLDKVRQAKVNAMILQTFGEVVMEGSQDFQDQKQMCTIISNSYGNIHRYNSKIQVNHLKVLHETRKKHGLVQSTFSTMDYNAAVEFTKALQKQAPIFAQPYNSKLDVSLGGILNTSYDLHALVCKSDTILSYTVPVDDNLSPFVKNSSFWNMHRQYSAVINWHNEQLVCFTVFRASDMCVQRPLPKR